MSRPLIINDHPLLCYPRLACVIGLNEALILSQIRYLLTIPEFGTTENGKRKIYYSYDKLRHDHFPFLSVAAVRSAIESLEAQLLLESTPKRNEQGVVVGKWYFACQAGEVLLTEENCAAIIEDAINGKPRRQFLREKRVKQAALLTAAIR
jgi:hypothetical protein